MINGLIILAVLIILSGFYSGSESAFLSLNEYKLRYLVEQKKRNATLIEKLKNHPHRLLTAILVANNVINLSASALATVMAYQYFGEIGPAISTGILTILILIFGEISPKAFATHHPEIYTRWAAKPMNLTIKLLFPIILPFEKLTKKLILQTGVSESSKMSEEELKSIISLGEEEGSIDSEEKEMIHNIFELNDITVYEVMTPRNNMFALEKNMKLRDALPLITEKMLSRIPLYDKHPDTVVGVLYAKDLLKHTNDEDLGKPLKTFSRKPFFVPETLKINKLLNEFKKQKLHIALVVDEFGGIGGLVTIEDLLEEIVGEIYDETDKVVKPIKKINATASLVRGDADFDDVNEELELKIPLKEKDDFETISGFILDRTGRIPEEGEKLEFSKFFAEIKKVTGQKIEEIKILKKT
ncbi:HlyC/CorC family transporter [Candidatus Woesearchaeota archaeon]|nr:HlyC/CorC family transporter [Candidatus Woesearchaeota archaeon]